MCLFWAPIKIITLIKCLTILKIISFASLIVLAILSQPLRCHTYFLSIQWSVSVLVYGHQLAGAATIKAQPFPCFVFEQTFQFWSCQAPMSPETIPCYYESLCISVTSAFHMCAYVHLEGLRCSCTCMPCEFPMRYQCFCTRCCLLYSCLPVLPARTPVLPETFLCPCDPSNPLFQEILLCAGIPTPSALRDLPVSL